MNTSALPRSTMQSGCAATGHGTHMTAGMNGSRAAGSPPGLPMSGRTAAGTAAGAAGPGARGTGNTGARGTRPMSAMSAVTDTATATARSTAEAGTIGPTSARSADGTTAESP